MLVCNCVLMFQFLGTLCLSTSEVLGVFWMWYHSQERMQIVYQDGWQRTLVLGINLSQLTPELTISRWRALQFWSFHVKLCALCDLLQSGIHICDRYLFGRSLSNLPNCLQNLSKTRLVSFNSDVLELDGLLCCSGISSLEHGRGLVVNRKLFGGDRLHLLKSVDGSFSTKIASYVQHGD